MNGIKEGREGDGRVWLDTGSSTGGVQESEASPPARTSLHGGFQKEAREEWRELHRKEDHKWL